MTPHTNGFNLIFNALDFAARKHRDQRRKGLSASPYINHPIQVARILCAAGIDDPIVLSAALLHDTVEDTETAEAELRDLFGDKVVAIVMEVTDDKALPREVRKKLQIEHASNLSEEAQLVKLADKICNLNDMAADPPENWSLERRREYFEWAKSVVSNLPSSNQKLEAMFDEAYAKRP